MTDYKDCLICEVDGNPEVKIRTAGVAVSVRWKGKLLTIIITDDTASLECSQYFHFSQTRVPKVGEIVYVYGNVSKRVFQRSGRICVQMQKFTINNDIGEYLGRICPLLEERLNPTRIVSVENGSRGMLAIEVRNLVWVTILQLLRQNPTLTSIMVNSNIITTRKTVFRYLSKNHIDPKFDVCSSVENVLLYLEKKQVVEETTTPSGKCFAPKLYRVDRQTFTSLEKTSLDLISRSCQEGVDYDKLIQAFHKKLGIKGQVNHLFNRDGLHYLLEPNIRQGVILSYKGTLYKV